MFTLLALGALLACSPFASAVVTPTEPGPADVYKAGGPCRIVWQPDTTGAWKVMNVQLMTGSNFQMVHLTTVATLDGSNPAVTTFEYPCPAVTPNSQIYFYQFTSPAANETVWTTRFTLADAAGASTPPPEPTQPGTGEAIPWGIGALVNPASAKPPPAGAPPAAVGGPAAANATAPAPAASTSIVAATPANPAPSAAVPAAASSTPSITSELNAAATPTGATTQPNGAGVIVVDNRIWAAVSALVAAALTFSVAL